MDVPIQIDTVSMELPIVYFKESHVEISKSWSCISFPEVVLIFNLENSVDADEMQH